MIRVNKLPGFIFSLGLLLSFAHIVFAQSNNNGVISRPVVEYSSGDLRDPFSDLFQLDKEKLDQSTLVLQENIVLEKPMPSLKNFKVQGVIWGGKFPQVIINNKVLMIGDLIDGAEIVSIEKEGIVLNFDGRIANLVTPGNAPLLGKGDKEEE